MIVVLVLAGLAVLGAVVIVAMGRGGEQAEVHPDHPPLPWSAGEPVTGAEAALLRLPRGLWGYEVGITDEALRRLAHELSERDTRIAILEQQVAELRRRPHEVEDPTGPADPTHPTGPADDATRDDGRSRWAPPAGAAGASRDAATRAAERDS